jgi:PPOX class probable F420-dependent enzyme
MLDLDPKLERRVTKRLQEEEILWFTSVTPKGVPAPNPVWFYWDGECIIVYSQPSSYRLRNIGQNPNVALTLQGVDGYGNNVMIINGKAELTPNNKSIPAGYWEKYRHFLAELKMTEEEIVRDYSVEIRVKPLRVRAE